MLAKLQLYVVNCTLYILLFHKSVFSEWRSIMITILFDAADNTILDMDYLICLIGYTTFVGNHYDSHPRTVQIFKNLHYFHGSLTIKSTGRFIGQDNLRLSDKGTSDIIRAR